MATEDEGGKPIVAMLDIERETKNTIRYKESDDSDGVIGVIYLNKVAVNQILGKPDRIKVTVEPVQAAGRKR
jgi:hypothetical protein